MTIDFKDKIAVITFEDSDKIGRPFRDEIKRNYASLSKKNIILDLRALKPVLSKHIKNFVELSAYHRKLYDKSFVVVTGPIALKLLPADLNVVPTMNEALDTIEIEEIERDLGFS